MFRKTLCYGIACVIVGGFLAIIVKAAVDVPETITIKVIQEKQPPVVFPHKNHNSKEGLGIKCAECHHKTKEGQTPKKCSECHAKEKKVEAGKEVADMKTAFHKRCKDCHKEKKTADPQTKAPTLCKGCHVKTE